MTAKRNQTAARLAGLRDALDGLRGRRRAFVLAYVRGHFNATQAAVEAGYAPAGARVRGHELLRRGDVQAAVRAYLASVECPEVMDFWEAAARLTAIGRASLAEFVGEDGGVDLAGGAPQALSEVTTTVQEGGDGPVVTRRIKLRDPERAMRTLGEMLGWNPKLVFNVNGDGGAEESAEEIAERNARKLHAWRLLKERAASGEVRDGAVE